MDAKQTHCALLCSFKTNILLYAGLNVIIKYLNAVGRPFEIPVCFVDS